MIRETTLLGAAALLMAMPAQALDEAAALELAKKSGCAACHGLANKLVGPSWRDIGKKYAGDAGVEAQLVEKVRKGGKGVWGPVPMPPNPTVKVADVTALVQFVLALK